MTEGETLVGVSRLLAGAAIEALRRFPVHRQKWRDVYVGLVRLSGGGEGALRFMADGWTELILPSMEEEQDKTHLTRRQQLLPKALPNEANRDF